MFIWQILEKHNEDDFESWMTNNPSQPLKQYLSLYNHIWYLPEGAPDFIKKRNSSEAVTHLVAEWRVMRLFHSDSQGNDPYPNVTKYKRESKFIEILENIPSVEADFIVSLKDKTVFDKWPKLKLLNT